MCDIYCKSQVLTISEFTEKFGSRSFLYGLIDKQILKFHYLGNKPYLFLPEIIEAMTEKEIKI